MSLYLLPTTFCASICLSRCLVDILRCTTAKWKVHNFFFYGFSKSYCTVDNTRYLGSWLPRKILRSSMDKWKIIQMLVLIKKNLGSNSLHSVWRMEYNWIGWKKMLRNAAFYQKPAKIKDKLFIVPSMGLYLKSFPPSMCMVRCTTQHLYNRNKMKCCNDTSSFMDNFSLS